MKTPLLLNIGTCFSASSPLHYTLGWDNKYCHTGHCKEHHYLYIMQIGKKKWKKTAEKYKRRREKDEYVYKPPLLTGESHLVNNVLFPRGEETIEKYINYYKQLWECIKPEYAACADFSNKHFQLTESFMMKIKDQLLDAFDLKFMMVLRDPVRRLFSACSNACQHSVGHDILGERDDLVDPVKYFRYCVSDYIEPNTQYTEVYNKFTKVWGKERVHAIIMEELWNPETQPEQMEKLSDFLNFPITKVHENVYYPDMGPNAPKYEYLKDQWCSDTVGLDKETWKYGMEHMDWIYSGFAKIFGYIPKEWGEWYET